MLPERYALRETPGTACLQRTEWNVRDSDATLVFTLNVAGKRESSSPGGSQPWWWRCCPK